jgi:hypothetical protein
MAKTAAAVDIEIAIGTTCKVTAEDGFDSVTVTSELSQARLQEMKAALRGDLERFREKLQKLTQRRIGNAGEALRDLQKRGRLVLNSMFSESADGLDRITQMCQRAFPTWKTPGWDGQSLVPPLIVVRTNLAAGIPVEILPLFQRVTDIRVETAGDLAQLASSFLGFSAIVRRDIGSSPAAVKYLENEPKLPLRMFSYRRMSGARDDEGFFRKQSDVNFGSAWPDTTLPPNGDEFAKALARHLWDPGTNFDGTNRTPRDQIFHFSCHCNTTATLSGLHTMTLSSNRGFLRWRSDREVTLDSLTDHLIRLRDSQPKVNQRRPLIFLSACGSAHLDPAGTNSFPELFLKNNFGFLGFIGSEATIPDRFASVFAQHFYRNLLEGVPIGRAMHTARWAMLKDYSNPLGLLYSLYAEPEIRLIPTRSPV